MDWLFNKMKLGSNGKSCCCCEVMDEMAEGSGRTTSSRAAATTATCREVGSLIVVDLQRDTTAGRVHVARRGLRDGVVGWKRRRERTCVEFCAHEGTWAGPGSGRLRRRRQQQQCGEVRGGMAHRVLAQGRRARGERRRQLVVDVMVGGAFNLLLKIINQVRKLPSTDRYSSTVPAGTRVIPVHVYPKLIYLKM